MPTLYDTPLSLNCYKVRLMLSLLGVGDNKVRIDLRKAENRTQEFLALNPFGQVPVLEQAGFRLRDSQAILIWLARRHGADTSNHRGCGRVSRDRSLW